MQKALTFMLTRHLLSKSYATEGNGRVRVAHPERPCPDYEDLTTTVFISSRILDAMVKRELVEVVLEENAAFAQLAPKGFGLGTDLVNAINHALLHADTRVRKVA
jgi:hypothetical protein